MPTTADPNPGKGESKASGVDKPESEDSSTQMGDDPAKVDEEGVDSNKPIDAASAKEI